MGITQITTCKGRGESIQRNIDHWLASGIDELVIVDVACPEKTGISLLKGPLAKHPKLTTLLVPPDIAGPYFQPGLGRNLGAKAARHEFLLFLDSDCRVSKTAMEYFHECVTGGPGGEPQAEIVVSSNRVFDEDSLREQPAARRCCDNQFLVRNNLFFTVNGFDEEHYGWGAHTLDFFFRAYNAMITLDPDNLRIGYLDDQGITHIDHDDDLRDRYLPKPFASSPDGALGVYRDTVYSLAQARRNTFRAQPGRDFGSVEDPRHLRLFHSGRECIFGRDE